MKLVFFILICMSLLLIEGFQQKKISISHQDSSTLFVSTISIENGVELNKVVFPAKNDENKNPPIILLHGLLGSARNFQSWAKLLSEHLQHSHDIICVDLRNHGTTASLGPLPIDYESMTIDIKITMDRLGIQNAHLIGHSMGGKAAAAAALNKELSSRILSVTILDISPVHYEIDEFTSISDTVEKLVLLKDLLKTLTCKNEIQKLLSLYFPDLSFVQFLLTNLQPILEKDSSSNGHEWKFKVNAIFDSLSDIRSFPYPQNSHVKYNGNVLIVKAARSNFVKMIHIPLVTMLFSKYTLVTVRDAGHWLHIDKPTETVEIVSEFLKKSTL
jgi:pimeloyl-ACP methyl ester carboxylesterase